MNSDQTTTHQIDELRRLRGEMRRWRIAAAVTSFVIITAGLFTLKISATNLVNPGPKHDAFVAELRRAASADVAPHVKERTVATFNEIAPLIQDEIVKLRARMPDLADAVVVELQLLNDNLPPRAEAILEATLGDTVRNRALQVLAEYPELTDDDVATLVTALLTESHARVVKVSAAIIDPYLVSIDRIVTSLDEIRVAEIDQFPPETTTLELALSLVEILRAEITESAPNDPSWMLLSSALDQAR